MKTTVTQLKKKVRKLVINNGTSLGVHNPYWMNEAHIKAMSDNIVWMEQDGINDPDRRFTILPNQKISLNNWICGLKDKYLMGN